MCKIITNILKRNKTIEDNIMVIIYRAGFFKKYGCSWDGATAIKANTIAIPTNIANTLKALSHLDSNLAC